MSKTLIGPNVISDTIKQNESEVEKCDFLAFFLGFFFFLAVSIKVLFKL